MTTGSNGSSNFLTLTVREGVWSACFRGGLTTVIQHGDINNYIFCEGKQKFARSSLPDPSNRR